MLETRASYGYHGEGYGATGENLPKKSNKSGWRYSDFYFEISGDWKSTCGCKRIIVKAMDYAHAVKQAKSWARRDGFTLVGDEAGHEHQRNW